MEGNTSTESHEPSPRYSVRYLGSMSMDRLYPQSMQPLVMAEVRRKKNVTEVMLEIVGESLLVHADTSLVPGDGGGDDGAADQPQQRQPLLEHHLSGLTRFAKLHQDPMCFAYLTRYQLSADFDCHVYMASSEEIIPQLFRAIREASKDIHNKPPLNSQASTITTQTSATMTTATTTQQQDCVGTSPSAGSVGDVTEPVDQSHSLFEVKYLGRIKVSNKRVTGDYIDQIGEKMLAREEDQLTKRQQELKRDKKRHPSNNSVKSLPDDLDDASVKLSDNNLVEQKETLNQNKGLRLSLFKKGSLKDNDNDSSLDDGSSNEGSSDNITGFTASSQEGRPPALHVDFRSDSDGSRERLDEKDTSPSSLNTNNPNRRRHVSALDTLPSKRSESPLVMIKKTSLDDSVLINEKLSNRREDLHQMTSLPFLDGNRTMLLQISSRDISLVSLEKKATILERSFKDISFVSQGSHKQDIFGIVARETGSSFICYILQSLTDVVVADIMGTLQMSFSAAYKKQGSANQGGSGGSAAATSPGPGLMSSPASSAVQHPVCSMCPMHQLHRLCQEIHDLSPQATHDLLLKKIHNLPERELNNIRHQMQAESPESFEESVELMMICLHRLCEYKQREHALLSVGSKNAKSEAEISVVRPVFKKAMLSSHQQINLLEEKHNLFEGLRNKARKSLTTSFENLIHRGRSKKEESKDSFRQRSWTVDSEAGWVSRDSSSATSTPDASPMPSPSPMSRDFHHEFPSPPASPTSMRKRSSTLGTISDSPRSWANEGQQAQGAPSSTIASVASNSTSSVSTLASTAAAQQQQQQAHTTESMADRRRRDLNLNHSATAKTTVVSPIKTMYLLSGHGSGHSQDSSSLVSSSSSPSGISGGIQSPQSSEDHPHHALTTLGGAPTTASGRRQSLSWRKAIFERVCTPQHAAHVEEHDESPSDVTANSGVVPSNTEVRALWKKAILETLLLIRMEKENHNIRARQEEADSVVSRKLDYQELTPCLKEITSIWENMLGFHEEERDTEEEEKEKENNLLKEAEEEVEGEEGDSGRDQRLVPHDTLLDCISKGVPRNLRGQIWLFLMQQRQMGSMVPDGVCDSVNYDDLLKQLTTHQHAILIDLGRTFPGHPYFSKALGPGQLELFNLLKAYSLLDTEVGYCQGISFIVGMLLMHMEEISAFHVLKFLMYDLGLRKQFRPNMVALQMKLYQLTRLLHDHYKDMYDHFETHDISPTLYAAPWFLTLFASQFPLGFVARVFDMIFVQGIEALFKIALVLLGSHRALILQCDSFESVVGFLKTTLPEMVQVQMERIINQAFELDITKELQAYEIEYHVLREDMFSFPPSQMGGKHSTSQSRLSTSSSLSEDHKLSSSAPWHRFGERRRSSVDLEMVYRLEHHNRCLKQQNMDLVEKLQHAQSQIRSNEQSIHGHQLSEEKLKSQLRTLELERSALLTAVAKLRKLVPREALLSLNLSPSTLQAMSPTSSTSSVPANASGSHPAAFSANTHNADDTNTTSVEFNNDAGCLSSPVNQRLLDGTFTNTNTNQFTDSGDVQENTVSNTHHSSSSSFQRHNNNSALVMNSNSNSPCPSLSSPLAEKHNNAITDATTTTTTADNVSCVPPSIPPLQPPPQRSPSRTAQSPTSPSPKPDVDNLCQQSDPFS